MSVPEVQLQVRVRGRHPWFYRKMIREPKAQLPRGGVVHVRDRDRRPVGSGFYNPRSDLALRLFSAQLVDDPTAWFERAFEQATLLRERELRLPDVTDAYRLVHAEGDGFPGLVLDRLGSVFVAQVQVLGMRQQLDPLGEALLRRHRGARLVLLQDDDAAEREGMDPVPRVAPIEVTVREHGLDYGVAAGGGHKTGFFADQRDNRQMVRQLARGRAVLDLCCNAGGFALNAAAGGARSVRAIDLDEEMVAVTRDNAARNRSRVEVEHADAFDVLRDLRVGSCDLLILDPPKWIARPDDLEAGIARYRDLNRLALQKVEPGGLVVTCSCSGSLDEGGFVRMLAEAAAQAGRNARVLWLRGAGPDHPVALECPQTRYLKVAVLQVRS